MEAVMISIRPQWCEKIARGEKTIEVRKNKPKLETPFKCYIYCTNARPFLVWGDVFRGNWETEFTHLSGYDRKDAEEIWDVFNGKVMGEFVCDRIYQYASDLFRSAPVEGTDISTEDMAKRSCLTAKELYEYEYSAEPKENCIYLVGLYGWHISELKIYDTPKKLGEFRIPCKEYDKDCPCCDSCEYYYYESNESVGFYDECTCDGYKHMTRPPQSWCYVGKGGEGE